jgi:hypothetical protein
MAYIDEETAKTIFKGIRSEKQRLFIQYYCNPESHTFDNATQSYKKAYNGDNDNVAAVESHRFLARKSFKTAIESYKSYLHETIGFELDWLDINLRNLYYRVKDNQNTSEEIRVLKTIGDRIGAFTDVHESSQGHNVPMTQEDEKLCNVVMQAIADKNRAKIKKIS